MSQSQFILFVCWYFVYLCSGSCWVWVLLLLLLIMIMMMIMIVSHVGFQQLYGRKPPQICISHNKFSSFYSFILLSERFFAPTPIMNINHHPLNNTPFSPRSATTSSNQIQIQRTLQNTLIMIIL